MKIIKRYSFNSLTLSLVLITAALFAFVSTTNAMVIRGGEDYNLESYQTVEDDLYVGAETVTLSGTTTGDVFAAGSKVKVDGSITEDAFLLGGEARLYGDVQGDLRAGGGELYIDGYIGEDAVLAGGKITITQQTVIEGDLLIFGDYINYMGTTTGVVKMYGRAIVFKGGAGNNVEIKANESISIQDKAFIKGDLIYESPREAVIFDEKVIQGEIQHKEAKVPGKVKGINWYSLILEILMSVIAAAALAYLLPRHTRAMVDIVFLESFWNSLKGLALLFAIPIIAIVIMLTMVGLLPGLFILFGYASSVIVAFALTPILAGVILARWAKKEEEELKFAWLSAGAFVLGFVTFLPIIGSLVKFLLFLFAFYAVLALLYKGIWEKRRIDIPAQVDTSENKDDKKEDTETEEKNEDS